jgi:hypothetical protein
MYMPKKAKLALALSLALAATAPAFAQQTSAAVGGRVVEAGGAPAAGADVTILHTPSGTVSRATTDANGRYSARGLRVGGPYTITIEKDGQADVQEDVYLLLGEVVSVDGELADGDVLDTVEVTGVAGAGAIFTPDKIGAGTNVTRQQIEAYPSINRNLQDYVRLDPRVAQTDKARNEISVGGQNARYNAIRVDGIGTGDTFGLESNSLPTPKQPFSIDVIEEIAVDVANYDVTIAGATGGVINAVTKSGTNDFSGTVYGIYRDNSMVRDNEDGTDFAGFDEEWTGGLTLGGPIIKDTLFFFLNYEKYELSAPGPTFGPVGSGASNIVNITPEQISEIQQIASGLGLDPGSLEVPDALMTTAEDISFKLDWNINEAHRASFRYAKSEQTQGNTPGFNTTQLALNSYFYDRDFEFSTAVAQLYSDWTDNFSTEAKISYRDYSAVRSAFTDQPAVAVRVGNATLNLGTEENTHANILETETWNGYFAGNLFLGDHELKFGLDYEKNDIYNLFGRRINGVYTFNSIEDFAALRSSRYQLFYPTGGDISNMAAIWGIENLGLFLQDTFFATPNLTLTYGLRVDTPMLDDEPTYNAAAEAAFGFDNSQTIDGNELVQPRFGFNYNFNTERSTQLRGGFGLFQGAAANVWLSNPFTNTGFGYTDYLFNNGLPEGVFSPDPDGQFALIPGGNGGAQAIDFVDPALGQPSVWKMNLALDHELPWWGMIASAEAVITSVEEAIYYEQLNLGNATRTGQDGRMMYWDANGYDPANWTASGQQPSGARVDARTGRNRAFTDAIIARPTNKGRGEQFTLSLQKPFNADSNWSWMAAYTYTDAEEVSPLTSSTSGSQFGNNAIFQANENVASRSSYAIKDRFLLSNTYRHYFFSNLKTEFSLVYEGRSGKPYSYVFDNDANGDGRFGNDLLYIPADRDDVMFGSPEEADAFWAFVDGNQYLRDNLGSVAERNGDNSPWAHTFDVRLLQELPGFFGDNKAEIWLDILNIGNLIDKDYGQIEEVPFPLTRGVVEYGGIDPATGKYVYRFNNPDGLSIYDDRGISRWAVQVGFRYKF